MIKKISIIALVIMAALTGCSQGAEKQGTAAVYPSVNDSATTTSEFAAQNESFTSQSNTYGISIDDKLNISGAFQLKSAPEASTSDPYFFTTRGREYSVEEIEGIYAKIHSDDNSGWIPAWYLSAEARDIEDCKSEVMLVKEFTNLYLFPDEASPTDLYSLQEGQVVTLKRKYADWYNVDFKLNDAAATGDRWVEAESLMPYDPASSIEGYIQKGAKIYDEDFKEREGENFGDNVVTIQGESDVPGFGKSFYYVTGAGGFTGYIEKKDFVPYKSDSK